VDKVNPPTTLQENEITRLKQQIGLLISEDAIAEYFSALESRYGVSINEQALVKLVGGGDEP
jgi:hypothetical protein